MSEDSNVRAAFMTARARGDADLALSLAREEKARMRARDAVATLNAQSATEGAMPGTPAESLDQPSMPSPAEPSTPEPLPSKPGTP